MEIGQSLRVRDMVRRALSARATRIRPLLTAKVALVDAVLECTDGHLSTNIEHSAAHFLRAKRSYNQSMTSLVEVTCVPDSNKEGFRKAP